MQQDYASVQQDHASVQKDHASVQQGHASMQRDQALRRKTALPCLHYVEAEIMQIRFAAEKNRKMTAGIRAMIQWSRATTVIGTQAQAQKVK